VGGPPAVRPAGTGFQKPEKPRLMVYM
jgi:hypothetical protein